MDPGLTHILLDSIAEGVVRDAPCHVLMIRQDRSTSLPEKPGFAAAIREQS